MIESILRAAINRRWLVMLAVLVLIALVLWNYQRLPIDAVPDITNVQVQINTEAPGYSKRPTPKKSMQWLARIAGLGNPPAVNASERRGRNKRDWRLHAAISHHPRAH